MEIIFIAGNNQESGCLKKTGGSLSIPLKATGSSNIRKTPEKLVTHPVDVPQGLS
jgi:hypothetical protein